MRTLLAPLLLLAACDPASVPGVYRPDAGEPSSDAGDDSSDPGAALQAALDKVRVDQQALGAAVAITLPDGEVWRGASGLASPDGPALTVDDRYPIGSITKVFTAVVILQLVEAGQLTLDDPVTRWFPNFHRADRIEVRQLLDHTSGIVDYLADPAADITRPVEHERMLVYPAAQPLAFEPGASWDYSNTNYILLGLIAEQVTGETWAALVHQQVIDPLGLDDTLIDGDDDIPGGFVRGYSYQGGQYVTYPEEHPSWAWSAGAIVSTLDDQLRFFAALMHGELLEPASLAAMKTGVPIPGAPPGTEYGLGLEWGNTDWGRFYSHGGLIHLVMSATGQLADDDLFAAVYVNTVEADPYAVLFDVIATVAP